LCWAAARNFPGRVQLLIEHGVDVNTPSLRSGRTPYEEALRAGNDDIASYLVTHGARKVELDPRETFALACIAGRRDEVRARLAQDPTLLERLGHEGRIDMLHRAVEAKQREGIRLIVDLGVDVNGMVPGTGLDRSALHNAAAWGGLEMVRLLLELGGDPQLSDHTFHARPIGWALYGEQRDVIEYLLPFATIFDAVQAGGVERARALLTENPSLADAYDDGGNPLVFYLHPEIAELEEMIRLLAAHGANFNARNKEGRTLVDRALARGWTDFADAIRPLTADR
jgi:ankyrin repeat protein